MAATILYKTTALTFYARIIRKSDSFIWNVSADAFEEATSWAASKITMTEDAGTGQYPVEVPTTLPSGQPYDLVVYKQAGGSPVVADVVEVGFGNWVVGSIFGF